MSDTPPFEDEETEGFDTFNILNKAGKMDTVTLTFFIGGLMAVIVFGRYIYSYVAGSSTKKVAEGLEWMDNSGASSTFVEPEKRNEYKQLKQTMNPSKPEELQKLKKCLMQRAYQSIPLLLELQTNGPSADK